MKIITNNKAVSHIVGFIIVFAITSMLVASFIYASSTMIEQRTRYAAELLGDGLADRVADAIMEAVAVKQNYPYLDYSRTLDIPENLAGKSYYVEATEDGIYVNTTDGQVFVNNTNYNIEALNMGINGKTYGSSRSLKIYCDKTEYVYRFDFGTDKYSSGASGYTRVTHSTDPFGTWAITAGPAGSSEDWRCRAPIIITNTHDPVPVGTFTQIEIELNSFNFDYSLVNRDASDILITSLTGTILPFWIEQWNYYGESTIWVKLNGLPLGESRIYLYHNYKGSLPPPDHPGPDDPVFFFFDDFNDDSLDESKWERFVLSSPSKPGSIKIKDGILNISDKNGVISKYSWGYDQNYILEAKALSLPNPDKIGLTQSNLEVHLFARLTPGSKNPFRDSCYIFSNGDFISTEEEPDSINKNYALIYQNGGSNLLCYVPNTYSLAALSKHWKILSFRLYKDHLNAIRTNYSGNPDGVLLIVDHNSPLNEGSFGLCNTNDESGAYAYFDWVYLRNANTTNDVIVGAVESLDFYWNNAPFDPVTSMERGQPNNLRSDFVCNDTPAAGPPAPQTISYTVRGLEEQDYSVSIILGDNDSATDQIDISINGDTANPIFSGLSSAPSNFIEEWFIVEKNDLNLDGDGGFMFSVDFTSNNKIPVCAMTVEKGEKGIKIGAG